jgi:hypothetical protein
MIPLFAMLSLESREAVISLVFYTLVNAVVKLVFLLIVIINYSQKGDGYSATDNGDGALIVLLIIVGTLILLDVWIIQLVRLIVNQIKINVE